ncbi:hypothetical protein FQR65_LT20151 [Abscondita terminalis]|nr:hypothetical protein FQR65_LT20151 [Abscondita terminalis]
MVTRAQGRPPELIPELPHHFLLITALVWVNTCACANTWVHGGAVRLHKQKVFGVSVELLRQIARLLDLGLLPLIPSEAVLCCEREVCVMRVQGTGEQALREAGIKPLRFCAERRAGHHERTAVIDRAGIPGIRPCGLSDQADTRITAMHRSHWDGKGPSWRMKPCSPSSRIGHAADRYSIRCARTHRACCGWPCRSSVRLSRNELNSATIIRSSTPKVSGFDMAVISMAAILPSPWMHEETQWPNLADLLDRQIPAGQGQHGARSLRRTVFACTGLTEQVVAALLITVRQGVWLRCDESAVQPDAPLQQMLDMLSDDVAVVEEDRAWSLICACCWQPLVGPKSRCRCQFFDLDRCNRLAWQIRLNIWKSCVAPCRQRLTTTMSNGVRLAIPGAVIDVQLALYPVSEIRGQRLKLPCRLSSMGKRV